MILVVVFALPTCAPLFSLEAAETAPVSTSMTSGSTPRSLMRRNFPVSLRTRNGAQV